MRGEGGTAPRPILVVNYGPIGDAIRSLSAVRMIKARHPDRPIDILCRPPVHLLMPFVPEIRAIHVDATAHRELGVRRKLKLVRELRRERYGRAYVFGYGFKMAVVPWLARIPERIGLLGEFRYILLNRIRPQAAFARQALRDCALALEESETMPSDTPLPRLAVTAAALARWREHEGIADDGRPVLAIAPGASWPFRRWKIENFMEIAERAHARGWAIWVLGAPAEQRLAEIIAAAVPARDFTPPPLDEVVYQLKAASVFLGNESGLLHAACALGVPSVGIFGPTGPNDDGPISPGLIAVEPPPDFDGLFKRNVAGGRSIAGVTVDQVDDAVVRAMEMNAAAQF